MKLKLLFVFMFSAVFIILVSGSVQAACVEGIDGVCDINCINVDYDCPQNPYAGVLDVDCTAESDGICDLNCQDSDWDCIYEKEAQIEKTSELAQIKEEIQDETESVTFISPFQEKSFSITQIVLIGIGLIILAWFILEIFNRMDHHLKHKKFDHLMRQGQTALAQGYSKEQITKSLKSQGYDTQFINDYLRALEHRP